MERPLTKCPICGGKLFLDNMYQYSMVYEISMTGKVKPNGKRIDRGPMEESFIYCENDDFTTDCDLYVTKPRHSGIHVYQKGDRYYYDTQS